jgi:hypothetical protein
MTSELPNLNCSQSNIYPLQLNIFFTFALLNNMASDKLTDEQKTVIALYTDSYRDSTAKEKKKVLKNLFQALFPKGINPPPEEKDTRVHNIKAIKPVCIAFPGSICLLTTFVVGFDGLPGESCP